jgi:tRNA dimethylallyltransferase
LRAETELARLGPEALFRRLAARDPETAATIDPANPARVLRALEVLEATGTGLAEWHRRTPPPPLPAEAAVRLALTPPRQALYARCDARLDAMLEAGVLDEVAHVMALGLDPSLPGMKAVGAPELMAHLRGELALDAALARAKTATRNYAKRQLTWIRNQMRGWQRLDLADATENLARALALIEKAG